MPGWKEDKEEIVSCLEALLMVTRAGASIAGMKLNGKRDKVIIQFDSGSYKEIDVAGDSGIAIIKDVVNHL